MGEINSQCVYHTNENKWYCTFTTPHHWLHFQIQFRMLIKNQLLLDSCVHYLLPSCFSDWPETRCTLCYVAALYLAEWGEIMQTMYYNQLILSLPYILIDWLHPCFETNVYEGVVFDWFWLIICWVDMSSNWLCKKKYQWKWCDLCMSI